MIGSRLSGHPFAPAFSTERSSGHGATVPAETVASIA